MTDEQIIKALLCYSDTEQVFCQDCAYQSEAKCSRAMAKDTLDLINRQNAEIEKLEKELEELREIVFTDRTEAINNLKSEAIKEFAEQLSERVEKVICEYMNNSCSGYFLAKTVIQQINVPVEEMTEGE